VGSGAEPQAKSNLLHFSSKIRHLVVTVLTIFPQIDVACCDCVHVPSARCQEGPCFRGAPCHGIIGMLVNPALPESRIPMSFE
jgi:hypothetical protein